MLTTHLVQHVIFHTRFPHINGIISVTEYLHVYLFYFDIRIVGVHIQILLAIRFLW